MNEKQRLALVKILNRIGSWSPARLDQWLRYELGDRDTDEVLAFFDRELQIEFDAKDRVLRTRIEADAARGKETR